MRTKIPNNEAVWSELRATELVVIWSHQLKRMELIAEPSEDELHGASIHHYNNQHGATPVGREQWAGWLAEAILKDEERRLER
jgi:hypothetical protein